MTLACSQANSTPSPATVLRMVACETAVTCTGGGASFCSASFLAHAVVSARTAGIQRNFTRISECSRKGLEVRQGHAVANQTIIIRIAGLVQGSLSIHQFEDGGFTGLVTKIVEPQTFRRQVGGLAQQSYLVARGLRFAVIVAQILDGLPLRRAQLRSGLFAL